MTRWRSAATTGRANLAEPRATRASMCRSSPVRPITEGISSARLALPVVAAERQGVLAVAVLSCERVLAELDGRPVGDLEDQSRSALAQVPHAARWADRFIGAGPTRVFSAKRFRQQAAPTIVRNAAQGIGQACVPDPDGMLRDLLVQAIDTCSALAGRDPNRDAVLTEPCGWPRAGAPEGSESPTRHLGGVGRALMAP